MPVRANVATTYDGGGGSAPASSEYSYTYNPATGTWVPTAPSTGTPPSSSSQDPEDVPSSSTGKEPSSNVDSKAEADKEYIEIEFNTLVGELVVSPSKKTIRIGVNDTVEVLGIGSYLSGKYFVAGVKRTLNKDSGYSQSLTVIKNGFGDSLKRGGGSTSTSTTRSEAVEKSAPELKVGDSVKIVGKAIYSNAHDGTLVPAWVKRKTLTIQQVSTDGSRVLLSPINFWTYTRYVQKQ